MSKNLDQLGFGLLQVRHDSVNARQVISEDAQTVITGITKQAAYYPGLMVVIYRQTTRFSGSLADAASSVLRGVHRLVLVDGNSVLVSKMVDVLSFCRKLVRIGKFILNLAYLSGLRDTGTLEVFQGSSIGTLFTLTDSTTPFRSVSVVFRKRFDLLTLCTGFLRYTGFGHAAYVSIVRGMVRPVPMLTPSVRAV